MRSDNIYPDFDETYLFDDQGMVRSDFATESNSALVDYSTDILCFLQLIRHKLIANSSTLCHGAIPYPRSSNADTFILMFSEKLSVSVHKWNMSCAHIFMICFDFVRLLSEMNRCIRYMICGVTIGISMLWAQKISLRTCWLNEWNEKKGTSKKPTDSESERMREREWAEKKNKKEENVTMTKTPNTRLLFSDSRYRNIRVDANFFFSYSDFNERE